MEHDKTDQWYDTIEAPQQMKFINCEEIPKAGRNDSSAVDSTMDDSFHTPVGKFFSKYDFENKENLYPSPETTKYSNYRVSKSNLMPSTDTSVLSSSSFDLTVSPVLGNSVQSASLGDTLLTKLERMSIVCSSDEEKQEVSSYTKYKSQIKPHDRITADESIVKKNASLEAAPKVRQKSNLMKLTFPIGPRFRTDERIRERNLKKAQKNQKD